MGPLQAYTYRTLLLLLYATGLRMSAAHRRLGATTLE